MRRRGQAAPWREGRYLVVDLETTGLDARRSEIISFGAVPVDHGRVQVGAALHGLVRPRHPPPGETVRIHGLREADLAAAPPAREALQPLRAALDGRVAVAHAAWFDGAFLRRHEGLRRRLFRRRWIDTIVLARLLTTLRDEPAPKPLTLPSLAQWIGVPPGPSHDALGDAFTTAQAFVALATLLDVERPQTVASLLDARAVLRAERRMRAPYEPAPPPADAPPSEAAPPAA